MAKKLTKSKARKILHDKEVHGHPLTEQQRKFFGAIAGGAKPYKAQDGVKTCPPGFVNIEGKCFDKASDEYKALYKFGIGYMDDEDTLVSSRIELPEVVLKPKSVLDFLDKINLGTDASYGGGANRYAFDQLGKKHGFIPNVKILAEQQPSQLEELLFKVFDSSDKKRKLEKTAHYNPFYKTAYVNNIKDYIAELSHHVDPLVDNPGMFLITDLPAIINQKNRYKTKGTIEYRAHEEIQPKLKKDFEKYRREYWDNVFRPRYMDTNDPLLRQERMDRVWDNYVSPVKEKKDGGWLDKFDMPQAQNGIEGTMGGLTDVGFNYNGAWGGTMQTGGNLMPAMAGAVQTVPMAQLGDSVKPIPMQLAMGGSLPGAVGFTYARTQSPAPSNGPYAKKTKASAQDGKKLSYSQWKKEYNLKETPDYNLKRAWELGYTPDKTGHLPTVDNQTGQFLKAKGHPTLQLELDWYNSPEGADFRSKNVIDSSGKFFKYIPKGQGGEKVAKEWLKNWYEERKALPEFEKIAGKRMEALEKIPAVQLEPAPEMRKRGMLAAYVPAKKSIIAADPSTMMEGYDPELGVSPYVLGHEMIHALDYMSPQSGRDVPSYPKVDFVSEKASGMSKPEYSWITSSAIPGTKTEVNAVLYGLRQAEGLKGNKPTTPDQMKSIIDKYKNLGEKQLNPKTKEGTMNLQIKNLLDVIGNDPEKLSELNNRIVRGKGKTSTTAQNGQEMKFYQEGLDFTPKTISRNGGWLDKYDNAQDGITAYLQGLKEEDKKKQPPPTKKELAKAISKNKPVFATNTREQAVAKADAYWDPIRKRNEADEARRIAEGKAAERTRESVIRGNADVPFTFPSGETKLWKDMDWREQQYVSGKNLGSTLRFNNWTDYINPLALIGDLGEGLATAPYMARETNSNLPYVFGIGAPLFAGTLGGLGARNTGQFVENVVSPLPVSLSSSASLTKPFFSGALDRTLGSSVKDFNLGVELATKELKNKSGRTFSEMIPITKAQKQKAADVAKQAHAEGDAFARSWFYDPAGNIRPDVEGKIIEILGSKGSPLEGSRYYPNYKTLNDLRYTINTPSGPSYFFTQNPVGETKSVLLGSGIKSINKASGNTAFAPQNWKYPLTANRDLYPLDPNEAREILEQRHTLGGVNFGQTDYAGPSVTLMGHGPFYYHPYSIRHLASHEMGHTLQNIGGTIADPAGIPGRFTSWSEVITSAGAPSGYKYYIPNYNTELGKRLGDAMVPPIKEKKVWLSSPSELHSDLMGARANVHKELMDRGMSFEDAMQAIKNQTMTDDAMVDKLIKTGNLNKFFKPNTPIEEKRALIRMLPATITGLGAASAIGASSQEVPQQQDGGEIPVDPMGYWNPENVGNPVTIPSNIITMEGVDQPLLGISDTGDVQYMEPGEDYEFDGESVTEYPVAQKGKRVPITVSDINDPRLKAYQDSLAVYNSSKFIKEHPLTGNYIPGKEDERQVNINIDKKNIKKYNPKFATTYTGYYWDYKKPVQPVEYRKPEPKQEVVKKPEPVVEKKAPMTDYFQGTPVYAPTPYHGSGAGAFVGYRTPQGDTVFVKPEDYERMGVPKYGREFIESKKKMKNGGVSVNNADAQPLKKLDQSLNFTNYNKPTKGGWLDKYN